jgi:small subunit ribosomal protein S16
MALKIRLRRMGRKKAPHYRIVIAESSMPRDGRFVATIGHYNPTTQPETLKVDRDKAAAWMAKGAVPTDTVRSLLRRAATQPETVVETVKAAASTAGRAVKGAAGKAADAAKDVAGKAADVAQDAAVVVADAAKDAASAVADVAETVLEKVKDAAGAVAERVSGGDDEAVAAAAETETAETPAVDAQVDDATADAFPTAVNSQITDAVTEADEAPVADAPGAEASTADAPLAAVETADEPADEAAPAEGEEPAKA